MWDNAPILGRFTTAMDPDQGGSDMSAKRAEQIHLFDELWAQVAICINVDECCIKVMDFVLNDEFCI